ncbi:hypothetical protein KWG62_06490 [Allobaculum mucilyticum]|nr:hypothetical protein KWG62_06490 [Allobaculum mucilyticum]
MMQEFNRRLTEVRIRTMKGTLKGPMNIAF